MIVVDMDGTHIVKSNSLVWRSADT